MQIQHNLTNRFNISSLLSEGKEQFHLSFCSLAHAYLFPGGQISEWTSERNPLLGAGN